MAEPVGHERNQAMGLSERIEDQLHNFEVRHFTIPAHIVNLPWFAIEKGRDNRRAMILHVNPVAHVQAVAIDRERLVAQGANDHERD